MARRMSNRSGDFKPAITSRMLDQLAIWWRLGFGVSERSRETLRDRELLGDGPEWKITRKGLVQLWYHPDEATRLAAAERLRELGVIGERRGD